jgi:hypothetical protein
MGVRSPFFASFTKRRVAITKKVVQREEGTSAVKRAPARSRLKAEALLEELKGLATRLGLEVREEKLLREIGYHVRSGTCRIREQNLIFIDRDLPPTSRLEILLDELARRDLGEVYVSPELRQILAAEDRRS